MPMAPAAARVPPGLLFMGSFLAPSPIATATVRLGRRARPVILGGVVARSGLRDGEWGADDPDPSIGTGRLVDKGMATLRRRIHQARVALSEDDDDDIDDDAGVGAPVPGRWTELERRHHESYVAGVLGMARLLEALLVNAGPGVCIGALALLLGVPASALLLCAKLIQAGLDAISSAAVNGR
jgi:hypothetical protein